jgi:hypothetical protein
VKNKKDNKKSEYKIEEPTQKLLEESDDDPKPNFTLSFCLLNIWINMKYAFSCWMEEFISLHIL